MFSENSKTIDITSKEDIISVMDDYIFNYVVENHQDDSHCMEILNNIVKDENNQINPELREMLNYIGFNFEWYQLKNRIPELDKLMDM